MELKNVILALYVIINMATIQLVSGVFVSSFRSGPHVCRYKACPVGHRCVASGSFADCVCDDQCSQTKETGPVCAEGRTYDNLCQLRRQICQERRNILVEEYGKCSKLKSAVLFYKRKINAVKVYEDFLHDT